MNNTPPVDLAAIQSAAERIAPFAHRTPVATCSTLDAMSAMSLFFKCEHVQKVGAFKFRGAMNAVMQLDDDEAKRGVATHSSGNHAQALALAAKLRQIPATIVMPKNAPTVKRRAVEGYGAHVVTCAPTQDAREDAARTVCNETGAVFIAPYDNLAVIAGAGTTFLELNDQVGELDAVLVPLGGGGLLSGVAIAARALQPEIRIIGVEPALADDAVESLATGHIVAQRPPRTIADGLRTALGALTFPIIRTVVDDVLTVSEDAIVSAMRLAWERGKFLIEPSAAVGLAAALEPGYAERICAKKNARVGIILTGGNIALDQLPWQR